MTGHRSGCLLCGAELIYLSGPETMECAVCRRAVLNNARCAHGHYVCDGCHGHSASDWIARYASATTSRDPLEIAERLMRSPVVAMHGPEHHFLVPAALLAAYGNSLGDHGATAKRISEARRRASKVLGGFCGFYGACGAAVGVGIFVSVVTAATPLSREEWQESNRATADALRLIADHGGPRCCKRTTYLAIRSGSETSRRILGVKLETSQEPECSWADLNRECQHHSCPFHPAA